MKNTVFMVIMLISLAFISCSRTKQKTESINQFDADSEKSIERDKVVVISDIHLGADLSYSECVAHRARLAEFILEAGSSMSVEELVIAGDLFDEWYIPSRDNTYGTADQRAFLLKMAEANKDVFDALRSVINEKKVKVTYVYGNHDLLVPEQIISELLPGIHVIQDNERQGVGTYYPAIYPCVAIEHCHRYDFFSAPDPYSNQNIANGTILPPGYFFSRVAVNSVLDFPQKGEETKVPVVVLKEPADESQQNRFTYYQVWKTAFEQVIPTKESFDEKIITTNIGHFNGSFSISDLLPYNKSTDGSITMKLYAESCEQENWEKRLRYNNVPVMTRVGEAIKGGLATSFLDQQSDVQYFQNDKSNVRVVVFGHTHIPMIKTYVNLKQEECVYANSGTWIDRKEKQKETYDQDVENMDFVVISKDKNIDGNLKVELKKLNKGDHLLVESKTIKL